MSSATTIAIHTGSMPSPLHAFRGDSKLQTLSHAMPTVFIVDDDIQIRKSLEQLISSQGWRLRACDSVREFLAQPRAFVPSAVILAFSSTNPNSLDAQKQIAREWPQMPVIVIADYEDIPITVEAMKAGAIDFLVKPLSEESLLAAIRHSLARSRFALDRWKELHDLRSCHSSLSPREQQVMALVASGLLNKQVGGELGISEITVKAHRGQVMQKMKAASFAHLVNMALKLRIAGSMTPSVA